MYYKWISENEKKDRNTPRLEKKEVADIARESTIS